MHIRKGLVKISKACSNSYAKARLSYTRLNPLKVKTPNRAYLYWFEMNLCIFFVDEIEY